MKRTARVGVVAAVVAMCLGVGIIGAIKRDPARIASEKADERDSSPIVAMARGEVDVEGGIIHIVTLRSGLIEKVNVGEGDEVTAGQTLAVLDKRAAELQVDSARAALAAARAHEKLLQTRQKLAQRQVGRVEQANAENASSPQSLDEARETLAIIDAEIAGSEAAVQAAVTQLNAMQMDLEMRTVRAPVAGRVAQRSAAARVSAQVQEGAELFVIVPNARRIVRAHIEEDFARLVQVGMLAEIRASSDDGPGYPAEVLRVGDILQRRDVDPTSNQRHDVRVLDCTLSVATPQLRIGQSVLVRFLRKS